MSRFCHSEFLPANPVFSIPSFSVSTNQYEFPKKDRSNQNRTLLEGKLIDPSLRRQGGHECTPQENVFPVAIFSLVSSDFSNFPAREHPLAVIF
jgi:hypothetical protein